MHLLLLIDPAAAGDNLKELLLQQHYAVDVAPGAAELSAYLAGGEYDALVADPGSSDFLSVLAGLRQHGCAVPVLVISSDGSLDGCVAALDAGADDFLRRPFAATELLARLRALLRRSGVYTPETLCCGDLQLDCTGRVLTCGALQCRLNNKEFLILQLFMRHPDRILSPQQLIQRVWGWDKEAELHVVWTYICNLRRKLRKLRSRTQIRSVRGAGYLLGTGPS